MTGDEIKMIGSEMIRALTPVYQDLEEIKKDLSQVKKDIVEVKKTLKVHGDKIDALVVEVHDLHQEVGAYKDHIDSQLEKIKVHIDFPPSI